MNETPKKRLLISYQRVSTQEQAKEDKYGLAMQTLSPERKAELAARYDCIPYEHDFVDIGVSAFSGGSPFNRESFNAMVEVLKQPDVSNKSCVCVYSLDRISRESVNKSIGYFLQLLDFCCIYDMAEDRLYDRDDSDNFLALMVALVTLERSHMESAVKSKRAKEAWGEAIERHNSRDPNSRVKSLPIVRLPLWYYTDSEGYVTLDEDAAKCVRECVRRLIARESVKSVFAWLKEQPKPIGGKGWYYDFVRKLHHRSAMVRNYQYVHLDGKRIRLEGMIQPIISEREFAKLYEVRNIKNRLPPSRDPKDVSMYTGLAVCRSCGRGMVNSLSNGRERLRCTSVLGNSYECSAPPQLDIGSKHGFNDFMINSVLGVILAEEFKPTSSNKEEIEELLIQLGNATAEHGKVLDQYRSSLLDWLLPIVEEKRIAIVDIENRITELREQDDIYHLDLPVELPTDRIGLKRAFSRVIESIRFYKVRRGTVLVSVYTKHRVNVNMLIRQGKIVKAGSLTSDCEGDVNNRMNDDKVFLDWVANGNLEKWEAKCI